MNDRLAELQGDFTAWSQDKEEGGDIEMGQKTKVTKKHNILSGVKKRVLTSPVPKDDSYDGTDAASQTKYMKQFFLGVDNIKLDISAIADTADEILVLKDRAVIATSEAEESAISETIRTLVDQMNERAKQCKNLLCLLKEENASMKQEKGAEQTSQVTADLRMRDNLVNTLVRKFVNEVKRYQNAQEQYKDDIKKKITHQVKIIRPDITEQEVDQIIRSKGGREALVQQQLLCPNVNDRIKTQYRAVADNYRDIVLIEASVAELRQMFLDFALLIEQQGEVLDDIEYNVNSAADHVETGNEDIYKAIQYQKKIRKKRCFILLTLVVVMVIVLLGSGMLF